MHKLSLPNRKPASFAQKNFFHFFELWIFGLKTETEEGMNSMKLKYSIYDESSVH